MSKKESLYEKDNWLHGWAGGDISFLDLKILKEIIDNYYLFTKTQAQIYISKYGYKSHNSDGRSDPHDISVKALMEVAQMISMNKYEEQGKMEAFIRTIVERKVFKFINYKIKHENHDDLDKLGFMNIDNHMKEEKSLEEYMQDCEEEIRQSNIPHAINNIDLLYKQKFEDLSIESLAKVENTTDGGIKSRLRSARKILQDCIETKRKNQ